MWWDGGARPPGDKQPVTLQQCSLDLTGLPHTLHELRVTAWSTKLMSRGCNVVVQSQGGTPLPPLLTLQLANIKLPAGGVPLHLLPRLTRLALSCCQMPTTNQPLILTLSHTPKLQRVNVTCPQYRDCTRDVQLRLEGAPQLTHITCTGTDITRLNLRLPGGKTRTALQYLDVSRSRNLETMDLRTAPNIRHVAMSRSDVSHLRTAPKVRLQHLDISGGKQLAHGLDLSLWARSLQHLNISGYKGGAMRSVGVHRAA